MVGEEITKVNNPLAVARYFGVRTVCSAGNIIVPLNARVVLF
jgi:hypothetical protein